MSASDLPENWAREKTGDLLRELLSEAEQSNNDSGLEESVIGRLCSHKMRINGYDVLLPSGKWATLAGSGIRTGTATGFAYFLGRIEFKRLVGAIRVFALRANELPGAGFDRIKGYGPDNPNNLFACDDGCIPYGSQGAWALSNYYTPPWQQWANPAIKIVDLDRVAARDMATKGVTYPQDFVSVRFARAETWGLLEVTYLFNPELDGNTSNTVLSFAESDWHASRIQRFPEKQMYCSRLNDWANSAWPAFKNGFLTGKP